MAEKKFDELQRELELTLTKLKAEKEPELRRILLRDEPLVGRGRPNSPNTEMKVSSGLFGSLCNQTPKSCLSRF
jgi:hypothetical protein